MSPYDLHRSSALPDANHDNTGSSEAVDIQLDLSLADGPREDDMNTRLVYWSPTSPDVNQHIADSSMETQIDIHRPSVSSVSNLSSSFSAKCNISAPRAIIDPFGSLPWFGLEEVLFNLPDLPTLHQLCQASPAVSDYLSDKTGIFPKVVERIMDPWIAPSDGGEVDISTIRQPDRGVVLDSSVFFRILVYLWWKEDSVATGMPADENPLPDAFDDKRLYCVNISLTDSPEPQNVGMIPLPSSTPPKVLRHLLSLASRIRGDAHAFFHAAMAHFKSGKIEELPYKAFNNKVNWEENGIRRPRGIPVDNSGADWPLTWLEEQRLMQALLKPYIFSVLRRMVCEQKVLTTNATPSSLLFIRRETLQDLEKDAVVGFWEPFILPGIMRNETLEQLETILTWKEWQRRSYGKLGKREAKFTTCCPKFTMLSDRQLKAGLWSLQEHSLPGPFLAQNSFHAVVRDAGLRGDFHKFGVSFWDWDRMLRLGLATHQMHRENQKKDLAFRWLTLLLSTRRRRKYGQKRPNRFRSRTEAITVAK
ncbi:hypothetical protein VN97_g3780 [Penicillium thymicola]|uniref:Uncharacterized protein n=1 Tax=Penicillium thymicola TaxID=293382 RepID=A0AAI9XAY6_PENTH|nr:hypothetical protein VN97_g3780 [Penicillium thymicola]